MTVVTRIRHLIALVASLCVMAGIPPWVAAQSSPEIDKLAARTSEELMKRKPTILLIAPREACNLALPVCQTFDSVLRAELLRAVPQIQIIGREDELTELKKNGFLAIDAYNPMAMRLVALAKKAEAVITEDLRWERDEYKLTIDIYIPKTDSRLVPSQTLGIKVPKLIPDTPANPLLVTDPDSNVSIIVSKGALPKHFVYPGCDKCSDPRSVGAAGVVQVIGTVTAQGKVQDISVVSSPGPDFTKAALDALKGWSFRPAVGLDGRSFATRQPIEVTFAH